MLVSTNGDADQTYTNTLSLGTTPVTAGASYRISANPDGCSPEEISVDPATGEVTFTKALYDKMTPSDLTQPTDPPARITIEATYQGKTASYTFTVTDHFRPRRYHSSVVVGNNDIYVLGGVTRMNFVDGGSFAFTPRISSNEVWRSSDGGLTWDQAAGATRFTERGNHEAVVLDGALYVIAGTAGDSGFNGRNDVWQSTDRGVSWSRVTPAGGSVSFPMDYGFASAVLGNAMYVMGGIQRTSVPPFPRLDQVWKSTNRGVNWTHVNASAATGDKFPARSQHAAVVLGSAGAAKLYVIGGNTGGGLDDVWESSDGTSWIPVNASAASGDKFPARRAHSAAAVGDTVYVIAGDQGGVLPVVRSDVWKSADKGASWSRVVEDAGFPSRVNHSSAAQGGALYVIGGSSSEAASGTLFNDVWESTDGGQTWVNVHKNP